jgi:hypothetical protein
MFHKMRLLFLLIQLVLLYITVDSKKKKKASYEDLSEVLHAPLSVPRKGKGVSWRRSLLQGAMSTQTLVDEYFKYSDDERKHFSGETLAYVTPWNSKGIASPLLSSA